MSGKRKMEVGVNTNLDNFAIKRLQKELSRMPKDTRSSDAKFEIEIDEQDIGRWVVKYYYNDLPEDASKDQKRIAKQLNTYDLKAITTVFRFSSDYPGRPPLVYIEHPRMMGNTIDATGAVCHEQLHPNHGWQASMRMEALIVWFRSLMDDSDTNLRMFGWDGTSTSNEDAFLKNDEATARKTTDFYLACHKHGYR